MPQDYLKENLERGWINQSKFPAGMPVLFVPKKNSSLCFCVNYRGLNVVIVKNKYLLWLMSKLLNQVKNIKIFTKLVVYEVYHCIGIKSGYEWKTVFRTYYRYYEYLVILFGLANALAIFQNYINNALRNLLNIICLAYLDNILIFFQMLEKYPRHMKNSLRTFLEVESVLQAV